jgi:hypothetical protein
MRAAEYLVPHAASDAADAECIVITFGPSQGGGVDENIDRWVGQFASPTAGPTRTQRTVNGMQVTRVEVAGTFTPMQMPGAPAQAARGASRLLGAIVQAPSGLWFFKLTGPDATVKAAAADFDAMIDSARPR